MYIHRRYYPVLPLLLLPSLIGCGLKKTPVTAVATPSPTAAAIPAIPKMVAPKQTEVSLRQNANGFQIGTPEKWIDLTDGNIDKYIEKYRYRNKRNQVPFDQKFDEYVLKQKGIGQFLIDRYKVLFNKNDFIKISKEVKNKWNKAFIQEKVVLADTVLKVVVKHFGLSEYHLEKGKGGKSPGFQLLQDRNVIQYTSLDKIDASLVIPALCHELTHAVQERLCKYFTLTGIKYHNKQLINDVIVLSRNIANYTNDSQDMTKYQLQPMEVQANWIFVFVEFNMHRKYLLNLPHNKMLDQNASAIQSFMEDQIKQPLISNYTLTPVETLKLYWQQQIRPSFFKP